MYELIKDNDFMWFYKNIGVNLLCMGSCCYLVSNKSEIPVGPRYYEG